MKEITYVTGIHGNEVVPIFALLEMQTPQVIANPQAVIQNKRFINTDMNQCFGIYNDTYESKQATRVLSKIPPSSYVIDLHTTSATTEPFAIIVDLDMLPLARMTGLKHIVYMKHNIKHGHALINHHGGISIEVGRHGSKEAYKMTQQVVKRLNSQVEDPEYYLYEVYGVVNKPGVYINFKKYRDLFYPVLAGEESYSFYSLKAKMISSGFK